MILFAPAPACQYNDRQVLKTLSKAVPRAVKAIFLCLPNFAPMGRVRLAVTRAARLSTCFHTLSAPAENREKKSLDWSVPAMKPIDLTGQVFGALTVLKISENRTKQRAAKWDCQCICGSIRDYATPNLRNGHAKSCGCLSGKIKGASQIERFSAKYKVDPDTQCWNWTGSKTHDGYGIFRHKKEGILAHRSSYLLHIGEIPDELCVCHHCDNPACVNPDHLFLGSHKENMNDRDQKGRCPSGEKSGVVKLTDAQVLEIKASTGTTRAVGEKYGVSNGHVSLIRRNKARRGAK